MLVILLITLRQINYLTVAENKKKPRTGSNLTFHFLMLASYYIAIAFETDPACRDVGILDLTLSSVSQFVGRLDSVGVA